MRKFFSQNFLSKARKKNVFIDNYFRVRSPTRCYMSMCPVNFPCIYRILIKLHLREIAGCMPIHEVRGLLYMGVFENVTLLSTTRGMHYQPFMFGVSCIKKQRIENSTPLSISKRMQYQIFKEQRLNMSTPHSILCTLQRLQ